MKSEVDEDMKEVTEAVEVEGEEVEGEDNTSTKNPPDMTEDNEHSEPDWGKKRLQMTPAINVHVNPWP